MICGMCERQFDSQEDLDKHLSECRSNFSVSGHRDSQPVRAIEIRERLLRWWLDDRRGK